MYFYVLMLTFAQLNPFSDITRGWGSFSDVLGPITDLGTPGDHNNPMLYPKSGELRQHNRNLQPLEVLDCNWSK